MAWLILGLIVLIAITNLVCWIIIVVKCFKDKEDGGVGKGVGALLCSLYAFIWGWQTHKKHKVLMIIWTICVVIYAALYGLGAAAM